MSNRHTEWTDDDIDELVNRMAKPIYVLRLAEFGHPHDPKMQKSAQLRAKNARNEIRGIVKWLVYGD